MCDVTIFEMLNLKIFGIKSSINWMALVLYRVNFGVDLLPDASVSLVVFDHSFKFTLGHIFLNIVE
jgi:hypothetical protein